MDKNREQTLLIIAGVVIATILICGVGGLFFGLFGATRFVVAPAAITVMPLTPTTAVSTLPPTRAATETAVSATPTSVQRVEVTRLVTTAEPSPTPAVCSPLPNGMSFSITPGLDQYEQATITIELTGLAPGEELHFIYSQTKPDGAYKMEEWDMGPVGENGRFTHTTHLSSPYDDPEWQIKVLHARGVVCADITLPPAENETLPRP